jgi:flavin-dependent dehydrogenase
MLPSEFDVVVVGARVAGASTAMLLANLGYRVLLVDRATLPSEIARGNFVYRDAPRRLRHWGLLDRILASGSPAVTTLTLDVGVPPLVARDLSLDGVPWGIGPRRGVLDRILLEAAVDSGVQVEDQVAVKDVLVEDSRVVGIKARSGRTDASFNVRARLVIGADGRHSRIAQAVRAPEYEAVPSLSCWYFSYWSGVPTDGIELRSRPGRAVFVFPTNGESTAIFASMPIAAFDQARANPEAALIDSIDRFPELADRVHAGRREERIYGTADVPNYLRKAHGPGWALVGDAGAHKDPALALGIAHALRDAELLATCVDDGLSGDLTLDAALSAYEVRRNAATLPDYRENLQMAKMESPPPDELALLDVLRVSPEDARLFAMANFGVIPREAFFNTPNMQRLLDSRGVPGEAAA